LFIKHTENIVIKLINCGLRCEPKFTAQITDFGGAILMNKEGVIDINGGFGQVEFTEPNYFNSERCKKDLRSDIYSMGVIFWEISSGKAPFKNYYRRLYKKIRDSLLSVRIMGGLREKTPPETPEIYSLLYQRCWELKRSKRPTLEQIIGILSDILSNKITTIRDAEQILMQTNNSLKGKNLLFLIIRFIYDKTKNFFLFRQRYSEY